MATPATNKKLRLEQLIYQVKNELLEAKRAHKGEDGLFELTSVEMEVKIATKLSGKAKVDVWVLSLGEVGGDRESTHTVKLSFSVGANSYGGPADEGPIVFGP